MNRRLFIKNTLGGGVSLLPLGTSLLSCRTGKQAVYAPEDFAGMPKADAHFHYDTFNEACLQYAASIHMHLLSINVDAGEDLDRQLAIGRRLKTQYPEAFDFLGTFPVDGFGSPTFCDDMLRRVQQCIAAGARGIKIWKNIGMTLKDADGNYVMADDPVFDPVYAWLEKEGLPLAAHLGEPRNCWLPYDKITMGNDLNYYTKHPEYHMYQHPGAPSWEVQIAARDHILEKHPRLVFVGAHIGSMEWNLDEVAKRFDRYPNFHVDLSARLGHVQLQTLQNRQKVCDFFIKYQDRMLYGSDIGTDDGDIRNMEERNRARHDWWRRHWLFLATGETLPADEFNIPHPPKTIEGLCLPKSVIDKIFLANFKRIFG
ncbi:MAG: amidohydrolase [Tannerella sp.]|jgi:predicted TIM-barrel fold metal-dependent hydrolase|nr:amidohydrolase [Tannerella sp.]